MSNVTSVGSAVPAITVCSTECLWPGFTLTAAAAVTASVNTAIGGAIVIVPVSLTSSGRVTGSVTCHVPGMLIICFSGSVAVIVPEEAGHLAIASCVYWEPSVGCCHAVIICVW